MSQTISGIYSTGVTLSGNPATIATGTTISGTANDAVGVYGAGGTNWTLTNQGVVSETGPDSDGVSFAASGTIINAGAGTIYGSGLGATSRRAAASPTKAAARSAGIRGFPAAGRMSLPW